MAILNYNELRQYFKCGDEIWACAYSFSGDKEKMDLHQKPIFGVLTSSNRENLAFKSTISYFVPYRKDNKGLAWSKAKPIYTRKYATSEQECTRLYNNLIKETINWHNMWIEKHAKHYIGE